jgi:hypothetical protein
MVASGDSPYSLDLSLSARLQRCWREQMRRGPSLCLYAPRKPTTSSRKWTRDDGYDDLRCLGCYDEGEEVVQAGPPDSRDGNGYPRPNIRWVFTPLEYVCELNILSVGMLLGKNLHPIGKRVLERSAFTHTR